jgi:hypothetical protein
MVILLNCISIQKGNNTLQLTNIVTNWEISQMAHIVDHRNEHEPVVEHHKDHESGSEHHKDHAPNPDRHNHKKQMREAEYRKYHDSRD